MSVIPIVDDDAELRDSMSETLVDLGHAPEQAADGEAALDRLAQGGVDAVLLDLRMPGLDGLEVLRRIRAQHAPSRGPLPIAVLTAAPTAGNTIEAMRLGAVDHLSKPVGREALGALVRRMLPDTATQPTSTARPSDDELIGMSPAMREVQKAVGMLADSDATVLVSGETMAATRTTRRTSITASPASI
ncbi:sigma-54-dependent transcriptional regulator [Lichenicola sp.]|uniref:sigma-54-dependent transcriptional regulator n=1 Tax=Lichenicola sp. TaxID=2804529 RepID=UPI003B004332